MVFVCIRDGGRIVGVLTSVLEDRSLRSSPGSYIDMLCGFEQFTSLLTQFSHLQNGDNSIYMPYWGVERTD